MHATGYSLEPEFLDCNVWSNAEVMEGLPIAFEVMSVSHHRGLEATNEAIKEFQRYKANQGAFASTQVPIEFVWEDAVLPMASSVRCWGCPSSMVRCAHPSNVGTIKFGREDLLQALVAQECQAQSSRHRSH